jgi:hypothetical protein
MVQVKPGTHWGSWRLDSNGRTLDFLKDGRELYSINVTGITSGSEILNWIMHLEEKTWVTSEILGDLVKALAALFADEPWVRE